MHDLHTHSTASDGTDAPESLVALAAEAGVRTLAITDHDTFDGWRAARTAADAAGLRLIAGVELSSSLRGRGAADNETVLPGFRGDVHLLAYFPGFDPPETFQAWVASLLASRWERNRALLARLAADGMEVREDELRRRGGTTAGRVHLARILVEEGRVATVDEAFRHFLGERAPGYVARQSPPIAEALEEIRKAGGTSSLAHPVRFWGERWEAAHSLCRWLRDEGLDAIEVWHSEQSPAYSRQLAALADKFGFGRTGGSDYHGANKPSIRLGVGHGHRPLVPDNGIRWDAMTDGAPAVI